MRKKERSSISILWYRRRNMPGSATRYRLGKYAPPGAKGLTLAAARKDAKEWSAKIEKGERRFVECLEGGAPPVHRLIAPPEKGRNRHR